MTPSSRRLAAFVLAALVLGSGALPARGDEKVLIVIRTGPSINLQYIQDSVTNALKSLTPTGDLSAVIGDRAPDVKSITASDYSSYARLENPDLKLPPLPSTRKDNIEVRQLPSAIPAWEFDLLGDTPQELDQLEITYADDPKPVTLKPTKKRDDPLTLTQFGSYVLKPPPGKQPVKFTASVNEFDDKGKVRPGKAVSGEWPKGDNFYLIRLNGFRGDRNRFAEAIKNRAATGGTALETFDLKTNVTLAIGEADATDDEQEEEAIEGNKLYVSIPQLRRTPCKRAYMLFPLKNPEEVQAQLEKLNQQGPNGLIEFIRKANPVPPGEPVVITPNSKPFWVELPLVRPLPELVGDERRLQPGSFGRILYLASEKEAKQEDFRSLLKAFPSTYRIIVYEFENETMTVRNAVPYKRTPTQKERTLANSSPMVVWGIQLAKLAGEEPKTETRPKDDK